MSAPSLEVIAEKIDNLKKDVAAVKDQTADIQEQTRLTNGRVTRLEAAAKMRDTLISYGWAVILLFGGAVIPKIVEAIWK